MFVITLLFFASVVGAVMYWLGRGVSLNQHNRAALAVAEAEDLDPDALVSLKTGEIIEPGSRKYTRAVRKNTVRFE